MPNLMVMMQIAKHYPRLTKIAIIDEKSNKWSCALMTWNKDGMLTDTIYAFDGYTYNSDDEAIKAMDSVLTYALQSIKVMSN